MRKGSQRRPVVAFAVGILVTGIFMVAVAACGGEAEVATATAGPVQQPTATVVSKPVATATAVPAQATPTTAPAKQAGTLNVAIRSIGAGVWLMRNGHGSELSYQIGISEGLFMPGGKDNAEDVGMLVESWELAPDLGKVTLKIRKGVPFHENWGDVTAADVVYSVNTANANVTPNTIQAQSGDLAAMFNAWAVVDEYTVSAPFKNFDSTWQRGLLNVWYQSVDVISKKVYDQLGETKANETAVATGPFKQKSWVEHDRIEATALPKHWRATAKIAGFVIREMPEEAARIAAIKTGEMQIIAVAALRNVPDLKAAGMVSTLATLESQHDGISFTGNLWEKNHAVSGAPLERKGLKADDDHPWIGDPDNPARMESARKVRLALAMAIDRKAINDTILGGLGTDNPLPFFSRNNKELWEDRWDVQYDVAAAKKLMAEAGYPNGFKSKVRMVDLVNYGPPEISKAVAGMWRDAFGLNVEVDLAPATWRPEIVARTGSDIWVTGCDEGRNLPADWPRGKVASSVTRGGFSCGSEFPEYARLFLASAKEPDRSKRIANNKELGDFAHKWTTMAGTVEVPGVWTYDPRKVQTWGLRRGFKNTLNSFETIELK